MDRENNCNLILKYLTEINDVSRRLIEKHYGKASRVHHGKAPLLEDDLDRYLWAFEKQRNVNETIWRKIAGKFLKCPVLPPSAEQLLYDQNIKLFTETVDDAASSVFNQSPHTCVPTSMTMRADTPAYPVPTTSG